MRKRNFARALRNMPTLPMMTDADRRSAATIVAVIGERLAASFPVRRLLWGEGSGHRDRRGLFVWWQSEKQWVARTEKEIMSFFDVVRRDVGSGALAFRLSPVMELPSGPLWLCGYVIPREVARQVGTSFNREVRTGRRSWWR